MVGILRPPVSSVKMGVAKVYKVSEEALFRGQRGKRNEARQVAMYLIRDLCDKSLKEIAQSFSLGSYGSVGGACSVIERQSRWTGDCVGRGLMRSLGGWSQVISARRHGDRELSDERILGSGEFVEQVIKEADDRLSLHFDGVERKKKVEEIIQKICNQEDINVLELKAGSRRRSVSRVRFQLAHDLAEIYGIPLAEVARHVGVSTCAISKILSK